MSIGKRLYAVAVLLTALLATTAFASSRARIVRLSDVQGKVQMDRGGGQGFERAFLNMPVIEGSKLRTGSDGRAEVEFEDATVLRIVPDSEISFTALSLSDEGQKLNTIKLVDGTAYVNLRAKKGDSFILNFAHESVTLTEPAHFRVNLSDMDATLSVFDGNVHVTGSAGQFDVARKHSATFDLTDHDKYAAKKNLEKEPYDKWDEAQSQYQDRYSSNQTYNPASPYGYGLSDLNYYGNYSMIPGYGWGWQPFFMEPVHGRRLDVLSRLWLHVGLSVSLGMDAIHVRQLGLRPRLRMVLAARLLEYLERCPQSSESSQQSQCAHAPHIRSSNGYGWSWLDRLSRVGRAEELEDRPGISGIGCAAWVGQES
jgi:hypothetical protein